jgi:imidazolonepropionase-like amidohydrolase
MTRFFLVSLTVVVGSGCGDNGSPGGMSGEPREVGCKTCLTLHNGLIFDGENASTGAVVVQDGTIIEVVSGAVTVIAGDEIDLAGKTLLPGLIDLHVHAPAQSGPYGWFTTRDLVPDHLKAMLRAGVTSFLDTGSARDVIFEYRARLREGRLLGPNMYAVGPLLTATGGHPCYIGLPPGDLCGLVDDDADAQAVLDELLPLEPDFIKIVIESGLFGTPLPQLTAQSTAAIVNIAGEAGVDAVAHVTETSDVVQALDAGVRRFAHVASGDLLDEATLARMAKENVMVIPTVAVFDALYRISSETLSEIDEPGIEEDVPEEVVNALQDPDLTAFMTTPEYEAQMTEFRANGLANIAALNEAGVLIATGTDAGNPGTFHGLAMHRELELYVEAGLTPAAALNAATRNAAEFLGRDDIGRLAEGAVADLLVVDGDPTQDIQAIESVSMVFRAGVAIDRAALALTEDTSLVIEPVKNLAEGDLCLAPSECEDPLVCAWNFACEPTCFMNTDCDVGAACLFQDDTFTARFCYPSDGCDPIAQDCLNLAACIWLGNGATLCYGATTAQAGDICDPGGGCERGAQCNFNNNHCVQLCDPAADGQCAEDETCIDVSDEAGVPVGQCE